MSFHVSRAEARPLLRPASIPEAMEARAAGASVLAGGTWIMRAPIRNERMAEAYVSVSAIPELSRIDLNDETLTIGAAVTHERIGQAIANLPEFAAVAQAASEAANPAVRRMATIGGNLCAINFMAADLAPALIAHEAELRLQTRQGQRCLSVEAFMAERSTTLSEAILVSLRLPRRSRVSAHSRLSMRKAGDYPVANLSIALDTRADRFVRPRVAVGSVEPVARRWHGLEDALADLPGADAEAGAQAARAVLKEFDPRDGLDAPGWYRVEILPALVRRALHDCLTAAPAAEEQ